jgi:S1-C subfamily serine protease
MADISQDASALDQPGLSGFLVGYVRPGSRLDPAGVMVGDIVKTVNGAPATAQNVPVIRQETGGEVQLGILRGTRSLAIIVPASAPGASPPPPGPSPQVAARLMIINKSVLTADPFFDDPKGAVILYLVPGSAADRGGLAGGDIVQAINGKAVSQASDLSSAVAARPLDATNQLNILRGGRSLNIQVQFGGAASGGDSSGYAGKHLAVRMLEKCENKPSAASFLLDEDEDDCGAATLEAIRGKIVSVFASKDLFTSVGDSNADLILTVTMTKNMIDTGIGGLIGDFTATAKMDANYALADPSGHVLTSGTVSYETGDADDDNALEQRFANKLAAEVVAKLPAEQAAPAAQPPRFGLEMADLAPSLAEGLGRPGLTGVQVYQCAAGSRADKAGIIAGDIIYEFDGKTVTSKESMAAAVAAEPAGKAVALKLLRGKQDLDIQVQF